MKPLHLSTRYYREIWTEFPVLPLYRVCLNISAGSRTFFFLLVFEKLWKISWTIYDQLPDCLLGLGAEISSEFRGIVPAFIHSQCHSEFNCISFKCKMSLVVPEADMEKHFHLIALSLYWQFAVALPKPCQLEFYWKSAFGTILNQHFPWIPEILSVANSHGAHSAAINCIPGKLAA